MAGESGKDTALKKAGIIIFLILILISITVFVRCKTAIMPYFDIEAEKITEAMQYEEKGMEKRIARELKSEYKDDNHLNYFYGADSYFYYGLTKRYVEEGIKPYTNLPYIYSGFFKLYRLFDKEVTLEKSMFVLPVILTIFSVIIFFFLVMIITNSHISAFIAALILSLNPNFLLNTLAGLIDTNAINILFSLATIIIILRIIKFNWNSIYYCVALWCMIWMFNLIWRGWFYLLFIFIVYLEVYVLLHFFTKIKKTKSIKTALIFEGIVILFCYLAYLSINSKYVLVVLSRFKLIRPSFFWIAELQGYTLAEFVAMLGGCLMACLLLCILVYILYGLYNKIIKKGKSLKGNYELFAIIYFFIMIIPPFFAKRFMIYFIPAYCIIMGIGLGKMAGFSMKLCNKQAKPIIIIIMSILIIFMMQPGLKSNMNIIPIMNDAIYNTATDIKLNSTEDAIINLWWDHGYFYSAIADRQVLFDGGSFDDKDKIYLVAEALLTDNESWAKEIFKNLSNGNNESFLIISDDLTTKMNALNYYADPEARREEIEMPFKSRDIRCATHETMMFCGKEHVGNIETMKFRIGNNIPHSFIFFNGTEIIKKEYHDPDINQIVVVVKDTSGYFMFLLNPRYENSMLFRMLYLEGNDLKSFNLFHKQERPQRILVFGMVQ